MLTEQVEGCQGKRTGGWGSSLVRYCISALVGQARLLYQVLQPFTYDYETIEWKYVIPVGMALLACGLILVMGKTDPGNYEGVRATLRKTSIADPDESLDGN
jgi:hypothetical protein